MSTSTAPADYTRLLAATEQLLADRARPDGQVLPVSEAPAPRFPVQEEARIPEAVVAAE